MLPPQGMMNSPTVCQWFVEDAFLPGQQKCPQACIIHSMTYIYIICIQYEHYYLQSKTPTVQRSPQKTKTTNTTFLIVGKYCGYTYLIPSKSSALNTIKEGWNSGIKSGLLAGTNNTVHSQYRTKLQHLPWSPKWVMGKVWGRSPSPGFSHPSTVQERHIAPPAPLLIWSVSSEKNISIGPSCYLLLAIGPASIIPTTCHP